MSGAKGRSGGHRSGAGRKASDASLVGLRGGQDRRVVRPSVVASTEPVDCPEGASAEVAAVWSELAPHAAKAGTLFPGTASAFLRLCKAVVKHDRWEARIEAEGETQIKVSVDGAGVEHQELKAHPLIARAQSLDAHIFGRFKDFAINPFGKPLAAAQEKPADPFAKFGATG